MTASNQPPKKVPLDIIEYSQGQYVLREGEDGDCAYIIRRGEVEVVKKNNNGQEVVIAILGANEIFGEMCLFDPDSKRSASVRIISERAEIMAISRKSFESQLDSLPEGMRRIILVMIQRLRQADARIVLLC